MTIHSLLYVFYCILPEAAINACIRTEQYEQHFTAYFYGIIFRYRI